MTEKLLQYIWNFQYFNKTDLRLTDGSEVQIRFPGTHNSNQGPDFLNARIFTGGTLLAGSIELHLKASDWERHQHSDDPNYQSVILHVVWKADQAVLENVPTLELEGRVAGVLLNQYETWMKSQSFIPCEASISRVDPSTMKKFLDEILSRRLERKAAYIRLCLQQNKFHWEETVWWIIAKNFGGIINGDAFESMARSLPLSMLARHRNQIIQVEAMLMGQLGLLDGRFEEKYPLLLQKEYLFLKAKYQLHPVHQAVQFLRMRPVNFPTIRLAQLAALLCASKHLFNSMLEAELPEEVVQLLNVCANDYWHYHFRFDEQSSYRPKRLGRSTIENILINSVIPLLYAYGISNKQAKITARAVEWLNRISAETNRTTMMFRKWGLKMATAFDSQAYLELKTTFCDHHRCLECSFGKKLLTHESGQ